MKPTNKSPGVEALLQFITGKSRPDTISTGKCMTCDGEADSFRDADSRREYLISGMCQKCQDEVFGP